MKFAPIASSSVMFLAILLSVLDCFFSLRLQAQTAEDAIAGFNTDNYHPDNAVLERLLLLSPSLRRHDFIRTYSRMEEVKIIWGDISENRVFREEIEYRFSGPRHALALSLENSNGAAYFEPILGYAFTFDKDGQLFRLRSNGLKLHGHLGQHVSFYASAVDNLERGRQLDRRKELSGSKGFVISNNQGAEGFDFDEAQVQIGFHWKESGLFLEKLRNRWGYGEIASTVLSDKAPSYPQFRFVVAIAEKLKLTFVHAALFSNVIDSSASYRDPTLNSFRKVFRRKYLAVHALEYAPTDNMNIVLGESLVYSDRFEPMYLLPLLFFRSAEHQNRDTDNAQLFFGARYTWPKRGALYGTLFVDDINVDKLFSEEHTNILAGTVGGRFIDVGVQNLDAVIEYTRVNPWVYTHQFAATTYESDSYVLGHWLGQNADLMYGSLSYRWARSLSTKFWFQRMRKGPLGSLFLHYSQPWKQKFLDGPLFRQSTIGFETRWEILRYLFLQSKLTVVNQTDAVRNRFPSYSGKFFLEVAISYNMFQ